MNKEQFKALTGAEWVEEMHIPEGAEFPAYPCNGVERELAAFLHPLYCDYLQQRPPLYIRPGKSNTLHAGGKIAKGSVVMEYLGAWEPGNKSPSRYRFGPVNGHHYRNFAGIAEDGFPNVAPFYIFEERGLPIRILFVALEEIEEGEMVAFNYGMNHSVKLEEREEYRFEETRAFFLANPLKECLTEMKELNRCQPGEIGWARRLEFENLVAKVQYLYHTPGCLLRLLLQGDLDPQEVFNYWNRAEYRYFLLNVPTVPNPREKEIIHCMEIMQSYFAEERGNEDVILEFAGKTSVALLCNAVLKGIINDFQS